VHSNQRINLFQAQDTLASSRNAYALSAAINYVHLAGKGAEYNFTLSDVSSTENISITGLGVESRRTHTISQAPILTKSVNTTSVEGGRMQIKNNDGVVEIGQ